jgi:hypothetical protein
VTFRRDVGCGITGMQRDTGNAAHIVIATDPPWICNLGESGPPPAQWPWVPCRRMGRMGRMLMGKTILLTWLRQLGRSPPTTHLSALNLSVSHCVHIISLPSRLSASLACPCCLASRCSLIYLHDPSSLPCRKYRKILSGPRLENTRPMPQRRLPNNCMVYARTRQFLLFPIAEPRITTTNKTS